jgi:hypothetical protein
MSSLFSAKIPSASCKTRRNSQPSAKGRNLLLRNQLFGSHPGVTPGVRPRRVISKLFSSTGLHTLDCLPSNDLGKNVTAKASEINKHQQPATLKMERKGAYRSPGPNRIPSRY